MFELYFFSDQWFELIKTGSADAVRAVVHYDNDNKLINTTTKMSKHATWLILPFFGQFRSQKDQESAEIPRVATCPTPTYLQPWIW